MREHHRMAPSILHLVHLLQSGRHVELESAARGLLARDMEDSTAWIYLGQALLGQQKLGAAEEAARKAIATSPESDGGTYLLALILLERNQPKEALAAARGAIRQDPADSLNYALAARALNLLSRYEEAVETATAGLSENGGCDSCLFQLSQANYFLGRDAEADAVTRSVLAADPEDSANHCARGYHLLFAGNPAAARQHFLEALRLQPNSGDARYGLAQSLTNRHPLFRILLKFAVLCDRWGWKALLGGVAGFLLLTELPKLTKDIPGAAFPVSFLLAAGAFFMVLVVCHRTFSSLMLLAHRETRAVVSKAERKATLWCLPLLLMVVIAFAGWFYVGSRTGSLTRFPGQLFTWALLTHLVWETFDATHLWVRRRLAWITLTATAAIAVTTVIQTIRAERFAKDLVAVIKRPTTSDKDALKAELKRVMAPQQQLNQRVRLVEIAVLLLCTFSENIRQWLERRAPDPD